MAKHEPQRTRLSKTEWRMMNHCWRLGKCTARQVYDASLAEQERDYQTVKTLLDRIAAKGYLTVEKLGPLCLYEPQVKRREVVSEAIEEFVDTVLNQALHPLVVHLSEQEDLTEDDLEALRKIVERQGEG